MQLRAVPCPRARRVLATGHPLGATRRRILPDGVLVVAEDGSIVYDNAALRVLAGVDSTMVGRNVDELVPAGCAEPSRPAPRGRFSNTRPSGRWGVACELSLLRRDGTEVPVEIALSPFDDTATYVVATVRDVSERLTNERRLAIANQQLALLNERERIGRDLHDVVLQRLYGTGLTVQAIGTASASEVRTRPRHGDRRDRPHHRRGAHHRVHARQQRAARRARPGTRRRRGAGEPRARASRRRCGSTARSNRS